jgi:hypothetical protein
VIRLLIEQAPKKVTASETHVKPKSIL